MDDNDVCPLCCEELDMSDRQFYPCKCGYQVCMWCWHRIRESESGLCPACRTPYGDDPHEFSAVDMEEVIKANKEKAAAEKRERERLRQAAAASSSSSGYGSNVGGAGGGGISNIGHMHIGGGSDGDLAVAMGGYGSSGSGRGQLEPPKDRNQLANMRVIRRNLVYAVGLPPSIATEETLRKPEYFGQYGKISKIVINRNHNGNGDPRRASASAYVTFAHKEDTLACILALDGFYHDGRNVRASYGTSKYCSAFIKNVRCNNPDCTYLHCMGDAEDTFTKQEIQAGYVTSGRDVLARQQQLAAVNSASGSSGTKRRVGGGGPSGSGKVPPSPVFPPPTFDEPPKPSSTLVGSTSVSSGALPGSGNPPLNRSASAGVTGFSSLAAAGAPSAASIAAGKVARSVSMSASTKPPGTNVIGGVPSTSVVTGLPVSGAVKGGKGVGPGASVTGLPSGAVPKKAVGNGGPPPQASLLDGGAAVPNAASTAAGPLPATAASVVAGVRSSSSGNTLQPPAHTTLTSLTPLKRGSSVPSKNIPGATAIGAKSSGVGDAGADSVHLPPNMPVPKGLTPAEQSALLEQRKEAMAAMARQQREMAMKLTALRSGGNAAAVGAPSTSSMPTNDNASSGAGVIGGTVIGNANPSSGQGLGAVGGGAPGALIGGNASSQLGSIGGVSTNAASGGLGGPAIVGGVGSIGGGAEIRRDAKIEGNALAPSPLSLLGNASNDKWGGPAESQGQGGNDIFGVSGGGIWGHDASGPSSTPAPVGNLHNAGSSPVGVVGGNAIGGEIGRDRAVGQSSNSTVGGTSLIGNNPFASGSGGYNSGSSALASMLGVELPTGSGSLRESSSLWGSSSAQPSIGANSSSGAAPGPIGSRATGGIIIGGGPSVGGPSVGGPSVGGPSVGGPGGVPIGGFQGNNSGASDVGSNTSDIALLQSLLPGVHITSGNAQQPAAPSGGGVIGGGGWESSRSVPLQQQEGGVGVGGLNLSQSQQQGGGGGDTWGGAGLYSPAPGGPSPAGSQQQQQRQTSIW